MVENGWSRSWNALVPDTPSSRDTFHIDYVRVWQGDTGISVETAQPTPSLIPAAVAEALACNIKGQIVKRQKGPFTFETAERGLANGLYIWRIRQGNNEFTLKRMVIR
jgi:hypothetical protein